MCIVLSFVTRLINIIVIDRNLLLNDFHFTENENIVMKQTEEKLRRQVAESNRKENMLLMRLTQKETENHELGVSVLSIS